MSASLTVSFTVLINNYNYARFLGRAIDSVLGQTWQKVQLIVVDDGSTDDSAEVANRYTTAPNFLFLAKKNEGQNSAIAFGLPHASGDYTIILDSDDWLNPQACETIARAIEDHQPNAVMYRLAIVDLAGKPQGFLPVHPFVRTLQRQHVQMHGYIHSAPTSGNAYRTDFLKEAFRFVRPGSFSSDGYLAWAAGWTDNVSCLDDALGFYLVHGANTSTAAGLDRTRRLRRINRTLDHSRHLYAWLAARGEAPATWHELIHAYIWREILFFKLTEGSYSDFSWRACRHYGVEKFLRGTHHGIWKQIKNIVFLQIGSYFGQAQDFMGRRT